VYGLDEAAQLKEQKLAEMQQKLEQQQAEEQKRELAEQKVELLLRKILSPGAKSRLKNIRLVNQEKYWAAVQQLLLLYQSGKVQGTVSEEQLKQFLKMLSQKRDISIKRK